MTILRRRYLWRNDQGEPIETPDGMLERVAHAVAEAEGGNRRVWAERFYKMMAGLRFLPNSPTLMNAGREQGQLSACYVLPIDDSLDGIFDSLKQAAKIHQSGGGTGFSFSRLRPAGSRVRSTLGIASGPVSFIRIFDTATETIKQGGARRGANMAILRVDHPDIFEFIDLKRDQRSVANFNVSVGITSEFMRAVEEEGDFVLRDPATGDPGKKVMARKLFDRIAQAAWECGDPGIIFLDRINAFNPTPAAGELESTNPCGEQPLLSYESCNLGSLNLTAYFARGTFNWDLFTEDVQTAVRFLDDVIDVNAYPVKECEKITLRNRKIGLGVMGFSDLLLMMGVPYDSARALELGEGIMSRLDRTAKSASAQLAQEKGAFPNFRRSLWKRLEYPELRNATVSTVAPTGTISILAGVSSGIEPIFAGVFYRNVLAGERLRDVHPAVARILAERNLNESGLTDDEITQALGPAWNPAQKVGISGHVRMQAMFQRFSDSAVSKTINLPEAATVADVEQAYRMAYRLGCKGITVYRDRSKPAQVLETSKSLESAEGQVCPSC